MVFGDVACEKEEQGWRGIFLNAAEKAPRGVLFCFALWPVLPGLIFTADLLTGNTAAVGVEFGGFPCFDSRKFNESLVLKS